MKYAGTLLLCGVLASAGVVFGSAGAASAATTVTDGTSLQAAFTTGGVIQLGADIPGIVDGLYVSDVPVVFDLNGHSVTVESDYHNRAGIEVDSGSELTIEDLSPGARGKLTASADEPAAAIGGHANRVSGTITIRSGTVVAQGGDFAAGIGGGDNRGGGTTTITGGTVIATGGVGAAAIGGGYGNSAGTVTISGGTVTAAGGEAGAGIGGGDRGQQGQIAILGGTVTASGGYDAPAFGGGKFSTPATVTLGGTGSTGTATISSGPTTIASSFAPNSTPGVHYFATSSTTMPQTITFTEDVGFDSNGGTSAPTQTVDYGAHATEPTVTRAGYTFHGWHVGSSTGPLYDFSEAVTEPIDLVAVWLLDAPTIRGDATAAATDGVPFSYTPTVAGTDTTITASGLPQGLMLDAVTGGIASTPTGVAGRFPVELTVANATGSARLAVTITVAHGVASSATVHANPKSITSGDSALLRLTASDAFGNSWDATSDSTFTSSDSSDVVHGDRVLLKHVGTRTITGAVTGAAVTATTEITVTAASTTLAFTGSTVSWQVPLGALGLIVLGGVLLVRRRRGSA